MRVRGTSGRSASAAQRGGRAPAPGTAARRGNNSAIPPLVQSSSQPRLRTARRVVRSSVVRACWRGKVSKGGGVVRVRDTSGRSASAARRGAGGELQRLARRREATTAQAKNA